MKEPMLPKNHYSLKIVDDVNSICEPLFQQYYFKYFVYARCFDDGSHYCLISRRDIYQHHFQKQYNITPVIPPDLTSNKKFYYLPNSNNPEEKFSQAIYEHQNFFNIKNPMFFFEKYDGYFDLFIYDYRGNDFQAMNYYLNNMDAFEKFKITFKEKAHSLIIQSDKNRIILPSHMRCNVRGLEENSLQQFKNRFYLGRKFDNEYLTKREIETLKYVIRGYTTKKIGQSLGISFRTIEKYIETLKFKLRCSAKNELIERASEAKVIHLLNF